MSLPQNFSVRLTVRPRDGVRDPQGDAVQEALHQADFTTVSVHSVGRTLQLEVVADTAAAVQAQVQAMCDRLLVNPNLETFDLHIEPSAPA
jgi:phosphoribosylformylglycinamidine synthase PurS subunit